MRSKTLTIVLLFILLVSAACTSRSIPASQPQGPYLHWVPRAQPSRQGLPQRPLCLLNLTVLAAASLTESFTELGKIIRGPESWRKGYLNFAGSQQLAQQLDQGANADVFASASTKYMDAAVKSKRSIKSTQNFVKNSLVVIFPKDNPAGLKTLTDLGQTRPQVGPGG